MKPVSRQSRIGRWYSGPWSSIDSDYRWIGPYSKKKDADSDRVGINKFLRQAGRKQGRQAGSTTAERGNNTS